VQVPKAQDPRVRPLVPWQVWRVGSSPSLTALHLRHPAQPLPRDWAPTSAARKSGAQRRWGGAGGLCACPGWTRVLPTLSAAPSSASGSEDPP
jgi:hypothetical protein